LTRGELLNAKIPANAYADRANRATHLLSDWTKAMQSLLPAPGKLPCAARRKDRRGIIEHRAPAWNRREHDESQETQRASRVDRAVALRYE